jgi:cobalt-zinc-cadmium efflux system membrane fusion protein
MNKRYWLAGALAIGVLALLSARFIPVPPEKPLGEGHEHEVVHDETDEHGEHDEHDETDEHGEHDEHDEHDEHGEHGEHGEHEGRTQISAGAAEAAGIRVERAGPATIVYRVGLTGTVEIDPARVSMVRPRFAGLVTEVHRTVGDVVQRGETLATVETNESLMRVPIAAPIGGLVLERAAQPGQVTGTEPLFVIADPYRLWVQLDVFGDQVSTIRAGQPVDILTLGGDDISAEIDWVSPVMAHGSQSLKARVIVPNPDLQLRPGQFVEARVQVDRFDVPLAVRLSAVQRYMNSDAVFARIGEAYEARLLKLGRRDADFVEVLAGLEAGEIYVVENSYVIKADLEKAGAAHEH